MLPGAAWNRFGIGIGGNICASLLPYGDRRPDRLPLHMLFPLEPGRYEVRYTLRTVPMGMTGPAPDKAQSEWTPIEIQPVIPGQRAALLRSLRDRAATADAVQLLSDILPNLLAFPDDESWNMLTPFLYHADAKVRRYALNALYYWPEDVVKQRIAELVRAQGPIDGFPIR
jgi:hypothetical protein